MLIDDPRLAFADTLRAHWIEARGEALVPSRPAISPRAMVKVLPWITIADVSDPDKSIVRLMGSSVTDRYGTNPTGRDWREMVPDDLKPLIADAVRAMLKAPCGVYYKFQLLQKSRLVCEAETLGLPLRKNNEAVPALTICQTTDRPRPFGVEIDNALECKVLPIAVRYVDIGAGVPRASSWPWDAVAREAAG
jgi:hypothetical protein